MFELALPAEQCCGKQVELLGNSGLLKMSTVVALLDFAVWHLPGASMASTRRMQLHPQFPCIKSPTFSSLPYESMESLNGLTAGGT
jgi:hypothetical protein